PSAIARFIASTTFAGVGRLMSPRWNGNTLLPFALHSAAASETAKAVSVPRLFNRSASTIPPQVSVVGLYKPSSAGGESARRGPPHDGTTSHRYGATSMRPDPRTARGEASSANWIDPPHNRWGFLHVRELTRTARIRGSADSVATLPRAIEDLAPVEFDHRQRRWTIGEMLDETFTDGLMVVHD